MRLVLVVAFFAVCFTVSAQLPDSIESQLKLKSNYDEGFGYLMELSTSVFRSNPALNHKLLAKALTMAESEKNATDIARVRIKLGIYFLYSGKLDSARSLYKSALETAIATNDSAQIAIAYSEIGITYYNESNDRLALKNYIESYRILEKLNDTERLGSITNNLGNVYQYLGDLQQSINFYKKAIYYKTLNDNSSKLGSTYHNLAISFRMIDDIDSALIYLKKARLLREQFNDSRGMAKTYAVFGSIYTQIDQLDSAINYLNKGIAIDRQMGDDNGLGTDLTSRADIFLKRGELNKSIEDAELGLKLTVDNRTKKDAYRILADANEQLQNFKASSNYRKLYAALSDSIFIADRKASLNELQVQFDTELKDAQISQLESEKEIQTLQSERDRQFRLLLIVAAIALIIILLQLYFRYRVKIKTNNELKALNNTKDRLFSIISHDLKSPLSSFHTITASLTDNWEQLEKEQLKTFVESLRDSSANVRDMMDNLLKWALSQTNQLSYSPRAVSAERIIMSVANQLNTAARLKKIKVEIDVKSAEDIQADQQFLEIIIRNLLSNALKFSSMDTRINILVEENAGKQVISLADSGVGMDQGQVEELLEGKINGFDIKNSTEKGTGLGLALCSELMQKMGAVIKVQSQKGKGTTFQLIFNKAA